MITKVYNGKVSWDIIIEKVLPKLALSDLSAGGVVRQLISSGGSLKVLDGAGAEVLNVETHSARHNKGGADAIPADGLGYSQIKASFGAGASVSIAAGGTWTVPEGIWLVNLGANTSAQIYDDVAAAWVTIIAAGGKGILISDGTNARLYNAGVVAESSNYREVV